MVAFVFPGMILESAVVSSEDLLAKCKLHHRRHGICTLHWSDASDVNRSSNSATRKFVLIHRRSQFVFASFGRAFVLSPHLKNVL